MTQADPSLNLAIVGTALRLPGASSLTDLWRLIESGESAISDFDPSELEPDNAGKDQRLTPGFVASGAVIDAPDTFDAAFFEMSAREALLTDPQHRKFLECAWDALEDAGCVPDLFEGRIGVFAGSSISSYLLAVMARGAAPADVSAMEMLMANDKDYIATRTAYKLNLKGPALTVQTACSTSLVALHVACQSLLNGECDAALVGGATILWPQKSGYVHVPGGVLSPDARCRPFDKSGGGTVFGSGVIAVVVKRFEDALADGDEILSVILGSAINNDGKDKIGFTAPSISGQADVIREAMEIADVTPDEVGYVEGHGTGTNLGDPVEMSALKRAFESGSQTVSLGSIKGNLGHLDAAAGLAGVLKASLALRHGVVPPVAGFKEANPALGLEDGRFAVDVEATSWRKDRPRIAGVSSFGVGGTNAHVMLTAGPQTAFAPANDQPSWIPLSAASADALARRQRDLARAIETHPNVALQDWSGTAASHRKTLRYRTAVYASSRQEAANALRHSTVVEADAPPVCLLLPGQGSQRIGMAMEVAVRDAEFANQLNEMIAMFADLGGPDLRPYLLSDEIDPAEIMRTKIAQPSLFAISFAFSETWRRRGAPVDCMLGHSLGEITAAALAGVFTPEDAIRVVLKRAELMDEAPTGAMLAVGAGAADLAPFVCENLEISVLNAPDLTAIGGPGVEIDALVHVLEQKGIMARRLKTSHAFHTASMIDASKAFATYLQTIPMSAPRSPMISNISGEILTADQATDPSYWARQIREPVQFAKGIETIRARARNMAFIEMGPGNTLRQLITSNVEDARVIDGQDVPEARLWELGHLPLSALACPQPRVRAPIPPYPFAKTRYSLIEDTEEMQPEQPQSTVKRLPRPEQSVAYRAPEGRVEEALCTVIADLLCLESIGADDNFFEIGGSSIIALQITRKSGEQGISFSPKMIFDYPTPAELSKVVNVEDIHEDPDQFRLSPWQKASREQILEPRKIIVTAQETLDPTRAENALAALRRSHAMLRAELTDTHLHVRSPIEATSSELFRAELTGPREISICVSPLVADTHSDAVILTDLYRFYADPVQAQNCRPRPSRFEEWVTEQAALSAHAPAHPAAPWLQVPISQECADIILNELPCTMGISAAEVLAKAFLATELFNDRPNSIRLDIEARTPGETDATNVGPFARLEHIKLGDSNGIPIYLRWRNTQSLQAPDGFTITQIPEQTRPVQGYCTIDVAQSSGRLSLRISVGNDASEWTANDICSALDIALQNLALDHVNPRDAFADSDFDSADLDQLMGHFS